MANQTTVTKFVLGQLFATPNALSKIPNEELLSAIARHSRGDWGDVCPEDWKANDDALIKERRLLSAYHSTSAVKFWIITEADRSITTVLLPEDY